MLIKYTFGSKSQTIRMRYLFQSAGRPISHCNGWSFRVYMIPLWDFLPEWNSRSGARTGVNSHRGDSRLHNILWWYHVNKYRAMRGNWSELAPGWKSPRCNVNTPLHVKAVMDNAFIPDTVTFSAASTYNFIFSTCILYTWQVLTKAPLF